ncbi:DEAD/DEAH box helicase family protein [Sphingomonas sp. WKB10]|nr:DEAD/DEAH box helicase family protein [Sphingomonas sp. WKB10]
MGAFIAWLYLTGRSKNFFVLAPNTTIYDKLVIDFSRQSSPKYVFRGIAEFAQTPPIIVTGDTWEEGRGIRGSDLFGGEAIINIFNVDKINKEKGRIRSFRETLGESYFDYLSRLPDLVMLMDEAHRYRAKAAANAVFELNPRIGLELTATPKTVGASPKDFKNVIYSYGLGEAMANGYVKEPAVATRADFRPDGVATDELERIMLADGVTYHEHVKVELDLYARQSGRPRCIRSCSSWRGIPHMRARSAPISKAKTSMAARIAGASPRSIQIRPGRSRTRRWRVSSGWSTTPRPTSSFTSTS